ncbi:PREDICTED: TOX high mobility group box family member 4-B isoform X2 [Drosophila arizonae]|uniref:TOX high mobility group box family member 4-B isoform X2 n=1 Tax=Drosophila arizonae TaxID=7263 RepID=A0ABM1P5Y1_DROAR|nr:PREDICTED: TOX high mobility group box family member 4-B isoform X2 [Drosophila arizonae]
MKKLLSRRISRLSSLDHSTLVDDEEEAIDYDTPSSYQMTTNQQEPQQQSQQPPAKPLAPYALFFRDTMTAIKQQNPACTLEQITAIALNMWESMDEKQKTVYEQRHDVEKREYVRQLHEHQRNQQLGEQQQQQQQQQQSSLSPDSVPEQEEAPEAKNETAVAQPPPPSDQIQLLTEAATVQKCTREQCNKPAIINPDWEDEYCSNECVVIHCRNVFTEWARSLQNSPT